jgi:hypothetical protein
MDRNHDGGRSMSRHTTGNTVLAIAALVVACTTTGCEDSSTWARETEPLANRGEELAADFGRAAEAAVELREERCAYSVWPDDYVIRTAEDVAGLAGYRTVLGRVVVDSAEVVDLDGLECLREVGGLHVRGNNALEDIDGLRGLHTVLGELYVARNAALADLDGLGALTEVGASARVIENPRLADLDGLGALEAVGNMLVIANDDRLTDLDGLQRLESVGESVVIVGNGALVGLDMDELAIVGGDVWLVENPRLTACEIRELAEQLYRVQFEGSLHAERNGESLPCD